MLNAHENENIQMLEALPDYQLDNLEGMFNYYNWIMTLFAPHLGQRIMEIGAGTGTFSRLLAAHPSVTSLVLVEPDPRLNVRLRQDFADDARVTVVPSVIEELTAGMLASWQIDSIVMVNVLEHLEDDAAVLRTLRAALPVGGKILTFSPAFPMLFSAFDASAGHFRRYTRKTLHSAFAKAGLEIVESCYFNLPGFFVWLIMMRLLGTSHFGKGRVSLFNCAIPLIQAVEKYWAPPVGQSIVAITVKVEA